MPRASDSNRPLSVKLGNAGFSGVFTSPPLTTREVLHPELYLERMASPRVQPSVTLPLPAGNKAWNKGWKPLAEGTVGEFDHMMLLRLYDKDHEALATDWAAGAYDLHEQKNTGRVLLRYASKWATSDAARGFFQAYEKVIRGKSTRCEFAEQRPHACARRTKAFLVNWTQIPSPVWKACRPAKVGTGLRDVFRIDRVKMPKELLSRRKLSRCPWPGLATSAASAINTPQPAAPLAFRLADQRPRSIWQTTAARSSSSILLTTCPHCQRCSAVMQKLYREFGSKDVQMLGCAVNDMAHMLIASTRRSSA
jgi:hypothetical protein